MIKLEEVGTIEDGGKCTSCKGQYDFLYMIDEHSHDGDETCYHEVCEMCIQDLYDEYPQDTSVSDDEWRREQAMEAGMLHGIDAYNEMMGY
jgi:hypothetical protein